jgi:hypothetical protein
MNRGGPLVGEDAKEGLSRNDALTIALRACQLAAKQYAERAEEEPECQKISDRYAEAHDVLERAVKTGWGF